MLTTPCRTRSVPVLGVLGALLCAPPLHAQVVNDDCTGAIPIAVGFTEFSTTGATPSSIGACVQVGADVWYTFTPTGDGELTVSTCSLVPSMDTVLAVYSACGGTMLACNDNDCGAQSTITLGVVAGTPILVRAGAAAGALGIATLDVRFLRNVVACTTPPSGMIGWWPFDEQTGTIWADLVGNATGTSQGAVAHAVGRVANAACFSNTVNCVLASGTGTHNPTDYTIDAWIKPTALTDSIICEQFGSRYGLYLLPSGGLRAYTTGTPFSRAYTSVGLTIPLNVWTHVAVVANSTTDNITFYKNGVSFGPATNAYPENSYMGTIVNKWYIGGTGYNLQDQFLGCIDEVEVFTRALAATEIAAIYGAGPPGKCKPGWYAPWETPVCLGQTTVDVSLTVCNPFSTAQTYQLECHPPGSPCEGPSPTIFNFLSGNQLTVPAGSCASLPVRITRPPGLGVGQHGCYEMCATNIATGAGGCCSGSIYATSNWCPQVICCGGVTTMNADVSQAFSFGVSGTGPAPSVLHYSISAHVANMGPVAGIIALNGLPPGEPVIGSISVTPGQTIAIGVTAQFTQADPLALYDLILSVDENNDGTVAANEMAVSMGLRSPVPPPCRADFNGVDGVTVQDIFDFLAAWFAGRAQADINGLDGVTVQDIFDFLAAWFMGC